MSCPNSHLSNFIVVNLIRQDSKPFFQMSPTDTGIRIYDVVGCIAIACNLFVIVRILTVGFKTTPSKLLLYLHLTLLAENVCNFPNLYTKYPNFCVFIGFIRTYFGLANTIIIAMIVLHYRSLFFSDREYKINEFLVRHRERLIFWIPLISVLPFITQSYGEMDDMWCTIKDTDSADLTWSILVYYIWSLFFIAFNLCVMSITVVEVLQRDRALAQSLCRSIGVYVLVAVVSWTCRCISRYNVVSLIDTNITLAISAIIYGLLFLLEMQALRRYEVEAVNDSDQESVYLSWHVSVTGSTSNGEEGGESRGSRVNVDSVRSSLSSWRGSNNTADGLGPGPGPGLGLGLGLGLRHSTVRMQTLTNNQNNNNTNPKDIETMQSSDNSNTSNAVEVRNILHTPSAPPSPSSPQHHS